MDLATHERTMLTGHSSGVQAVAFSPDGRLLASASVAFSPDSRTLASTSLDHTVRLWDPATGQATATLFGHTGFVHSVAFSPDGHTLAGGSQDRTIRLWPLP